MHVPTGHVGTKDEMDKLAAKEGGEVVPIDPEELTPAQQDRLDNNEQPVVKAKDFTSALGKQRHDAAVKAKNRRRSKMAKRTKVQQRKAAKRKRKW